MELGQINKSPIQIVTGDRGVGKSTYCQHKVDEAITKSWKVTGLLSIAQVADGEKIGIEIMDLSNGDRRILASRISSSFIGPRLGSWFFDEKTLQWGNEVLARALPSDLLVVDELGILEFDQEQGFTSAFEILDQGSFNLALVVVRPEYLDVAISRWSWADVTWIR